ncbi:hypothetical protein N7922_00450 [Kosakonia sp. ML.JS2a]|uniref:hypothetical protein n=1 Tax=Kosakonia sp. ML.JS2a TaxID=2980557 RepID=UPI0021DB58B6|nr:hypothetical protein [Kosakonia sp. ML.JS2a]UXY11037.1 hypothetical protein N7922_00450 [Kosakonia sp. ML.JS2a]
MPDLDELKAKLADVVVENNFPLEERTPAQILDFLQRYTESIPFASDENSLWGDFWFNGITPQLLSDIYTGVTPADRNLPVQHTFLLLLLGLLETPKLLLNTVPDRHRTLYYQDLLGFDHGAIKPDTVAVSFNLKSNSKSWLLPAGTLLDAGQDAAGNTLTYQTDSDILLNHQQLVKLCWTKQDASGNWLLMTALDTDNNIELPEGGIRLFSTTQHVEGLQRELVLDSILVGLNGDISVNVLSGSDVTRSSSEITPTVSLLGQKQTPLVFRATRASDSEVLYRLPSSLLIKDWHQDASAREDASLVLQYPAGKLAALPTSYQVTISQVQDIGYLPQSGHGFLDSVSYPFGSQPVLGDGFELALPSALIESGGTLTISPQWQNLPTENFALWYFRYTTPPADNTVFKASLYLVMPSGDRSLLVEQALFTGEGAPQMRPLTVTLPADLDASAGGYSIRVELSGSDFHHQEWANDPTGKNAPWTPQVSRIDTQFTQTVTLEQILGRTALLRAGEVTEQAIYIGMSGVVAGDSVSIYWAMQSLSALTLSWYCYTSERAWQALDATLSDATQGLLFSGLWQAILPGNVAVGGDGLSDEYYWLKGVVTSVSSDIAPKVRNLFTNAMTATLNLSGEVDSSHFSQPLPAGTISQLMSPVVPISSVNQLLPSEGGKARETTVELFERTALRIATRHRAITWQDMRHMLLEQYPQVYDIHFLDVSKLLTIPALTVQELVIIPGSRVSDNDDMLRPALSQGRLEEMTKWLKTFTCPWASPKLTNPNYVDITARYQVTFLDGVNPTYGYQQLSDWLQQRYMPWGTDLQQAVALGNQIDYYQLLATIQQHPLVQNVLLLELVDAEGNTLEETIVAQENEVLILTPQAKSDA